MSKNTRSKIGRRQFVSSTAAGIVGAGAVLGAQSTSSSTASSSSRVQGANNRVRVALIGAGRQGIGVMRNHMRLDDVDVVAVCDVYKPNLDRALGFAVEGEANSAT